MAESITETDNKSLIQSLKGKVLCFTICNGYTDLIYFVYTFNLLYIFSLLNIINYFYINIKIYKTQSFL